MFQDLPIVANYKHINLQEKPFRELGSVLCDDLYGWDGGDGREVQEVGDICTHITDSLHCTEETNTTL